MMKKQKRWSEMTTDELAASTKEFDVPDQRRRAGKAPQAELAQLHRVQRRAAANRFRIALVLEKNLVEATDNYATSRGLTFSDVVSDALRRLMRQKSA